jgi:predicted RNA-binding protein
LGVLVLVVSALAVLWLFQSSSDRTGVLALAGPVERGEVVTAEDLVTVEVAADEAIAVTRPDDVAGVVGRVALVDLPAGSLITASQVASADEVQVGEGVVGLRLEPGQVPALRLTPGTTVSVLLTPPSAMASESLTASQIEARSEVLVDAATVVDAAALGGQGEMVVSLSMTEDQARMVASAATLGRVRLVQVAR